MKTWKWALAEETLPKGMKAERVGAVLRGALGYVRECAANQVTFEEVPEPERAELVFGFEDFGPDDPSNGNWELIGERSFVAFNTRYRWKTAWWEIWNKQSLRTIAIHEIVHVLGLYRKQHAGDEGYHNPDPGSVMHSTPKFPHLTPNDIALLRYVTRGSK